MPFCLADFTFMEGMSILLLFDPLVFFRWFLATTGLPTATGSPACRRHFLSLFRHLSNKSRQRQPEWPV